MTPEELGRRAVACKHWKWAPGLLLQPLDSRTAVVESEYIHDAPWSLKRSKFPDLRPDLSDPCTLGGVLAIVREAWGNSRIALQWDHNFAHWSCGYSPDNHSWVNYGAGETEAEALVAALEAAP